MQHRSQRGRARRALAAPGWAPSRGAGWPCKGGNVARGGGHSSVSVGHVGGAANDRGRDNPPGWVGGDGGVGGRRRPATSASPPIADRSGGVVHVAVSPRRPWF